MIVHDGIALKFEKVEQNYQVLHKNHFLGTFSFTESHWTFRPQGYHFTKTALHKIWWEFEYRIDNPNPP